MKNVELVWDKVSMKAIFDLIVIGTGTAGSSVAQRCSAAGWRVAIVDNRPFGGACALRGCEPKKTLWTVVEAYDRARRSSDAGLAGGEGLRIDWPALMAFKRSFTDPVPVHRAKRYAEAGIEAFAGTARFVRPDAVAIGDEVLVAKHISYRNRRQARIFANWRRRTFEDKR